jgi:uroporphyrinogen-III synthase
VGRARHQAGALSGELRKLGATVIEVPFIEILKPRSLRPLDTALRDLNHYDWLILTSVNGVEALLERMTRLRIKKQALQHLRVAAIGPATKKAIEQGGIKVDVVPKEYIAESVVRSLRHRVRGKRVLLVRAKVARDVIPSELRKAGAQVDVVEAYETVVPQSSRARLRKLLLNPVQRPHLVTFTSSSTVRNFVELLADKRVQLAPQPLARVSSARPRARAKEVNLAKISLEGVRFASIGPVTSSTLRAHGLPVDIEALEFNIPGLVESIVASSTAAPSRDRLPSRK